MRFARVKDGTIIEMMHGTVDDAWRWFSPDEIATFTAVPISAGIAWRNIDGVWTPPEPEPQPVPSVVSPYQARMALLGAGLLGQVEALMADPDTPQAAKIAWEYATIIDRNSAFIQSLGPALGLTEANIDALFVAAAQVA